MNAAVIDIETAPDLDAFDRLYGDVQWDREEALTRVPGNYKKPEAIAGWLEKDEAEFYEKLGSKRDKAALNPWTAQILVIGVMELESGDDQVQYIHGNTEKDTLQAFWDWQARRIGDLFFWPGCSNSDSAFDVEFLVKRAWRNRIVFTSPFSESGYLYRDWINLTRVFCAGKRGDYVSLDNAVKLLGMEDSVPQANEVEGATFWQYWQSTDERHKLAEEYLAADLKKTAAIAKVIL